MGLYCVAEINIYIEYRRPTCVVIVSVSSLAQTLHTLSWYQTLLMATFSSSAYILCIWVPLSLLQLQSNLSGECKFGTQGFGSYTKWFCCHIPFILVWSISFDNFRVVSGVRTHQMVPMSCVMSLSMSEHCHHCQGTGPAVSREIKGNSPKISLKDYCSCR